MHLLTLLNQYMVSVGEKLILENIFHRGHPGQDADLSPGTHTVTHYGRHRDASSVNGMAWVWCLTPPA